MPADRRPPASPRSPVRPVVLGMLLSLPLALGACSKGGAPTGSNASASAGDAGPSTLASGNTLRADLAKVEAACKWSELDGYELCKELDAFGAAHCPAPGPCAETRRACLAALGEDAVARAAGACLLHHAAKDDVPALLTAFEAAKKPAVRIDLARTLASLRAAEGPSAATVVRLVRALRANDPSQKHLLAALRPEGEKDATPEAFALARELFLAPALNPHGPAANLLEAAPTRRAEVCKLYADRVGVDLDNWSWEGDWVSTRMREHAECDADFARVFPLLLRRIESYASKDPPTTDSRPLRFAEELGETRPLTAPQTKALVASLEKVAKKAPSDSMKKAAERAKARYAK